MNDMKKAHQQPEGKLIERALRNAGKSARQLGREVELSEGRVRQIINGYRSESGQVIPIIGPADTVARLAVAAGVPADQMRDAGRPDAADQMDPPHAVTITDDGGLVLTDLAPTRGALRVWLDAADAGSSEAPPTAALALWDFDQLTKGLEVKHEDELRLRDHLIEFFGKRQTSDLLVGDDVDPYAEGGDGDADKNAGGSAPTTPVRPKRSDFARTAHNEDRPIEDEQRDGQG